MTSINQVKYRYDWVKTKLLRLAFPAKDESAKLTNSIRKKIKILGTHYEDGNSNCKGYTYHPIPFKEFNDIAYHRDISSCDERFKTISAVANLNSGDRLLDIGANVGFFSFSFAKEGAIVDAIELQSESFEIGAALAKLYSQNVCYINHPISQKLLSHLDNEYKCTLLLSVFHWILKQCGRAEAINILRNIAQRSEIVIFEVPASHEDGMVLHNDFSSLEKVKLFLAEALPDHSVSEILTGKSWGNRVLFKIHKS